MNISQALAALSEKYPKHFINIAAEIDSFYHGTEQRDTTASVTVYIASMGGTGGAHYKAESLEAAVRAAIGGPAPKTTIEQADDIVAEAEAMMKPHPATDPVNLATAILNAH